MHRSVLIVAALLSASLAAHADVGTEVVGFEWIHPTAVGESLFVSGDLAELGEGDITRSVKMVWKGPAAGGSQWGIEIALPRNTSYEYSFVVRDDSVTLLKDPGNGTVVAGPFTAATTPVTPATRDLVVFHRGAAYTEATFTTAGGDLVTLPLRAVPNRTDVTFARLKNQRNGAGMSVQIGPLHFTSPLHTVWNNFIRQYDYEPIDGAASIGYFRSFVLPTSTVPATRTIDDVTGRGYQVYVPRGYDVETDRYYPVLYMHDGQNCFGAGGPFGSWRAEDAADALTRQTLMREIIIVAVDNSPERAAEYVPEFGNATVTNADYNSFIVDELKPAIDANYRTLPGRETTGIMGSSFGGVASLSLGLNYPEVFGNVGALSTSFWATPSVRAAVENGGIPETTRLYLDAGDTNDAASTTIAVRDELLADGRVLKQNLDFQIGFNQQHNEAAWSQRVFQAFPYLFPIFESTGDLEALIPIEGDINLDGMVNNVDLGILLAQYLGPPGEPSADLDQNGVVNNVDLGVLLAHYLEGT